MTDRTKLCLIDDLINNYYEFCFPMDDKTGPYLGAVIDCIQVILHYGEKKEE